MKFRFDSKSAFWRIINIKNMHIIMCNSLFLFAWIKLGISYGWDSTWNESKEPQSPDKVNLLA